MNLIIAIQNRRDKKVFISHLIIAMLIIIWTQYHNAMNIIIWCAYLITFIIQSAVFKTFNNIKENKFNNILIGISAFLIVILLVTKIIFWIPKYIGVIGRINYKTEIEREISNTFEEYTGQNYTIVKKQGKIGYTSQGQQKIPCIYTQAGELEGFDNIYVEGKIYPITVVIENGEYKILSTNGNTVNLGTNPVNFDGWKDYEETFRIMGLFIYNFNKASENI